MQDLVQGYRIDLLVRLFFFFCSVLVVGERINSVIGLLVARLDVAFFTIARFL